MKDWKICVEIDPCNTPFIEDTELSMPFIPRKGEIVHLDHATEKELEGKIEKCIQRNRNGCGEYCHHAMLRGGVDISDSVFVACVEHDIENRKTIITLEDTRDD